MRAFFKRYYCPNNASIAIVGDIDVATTKALVAKYFGTIPRGADVPPIRATTPTITSERRATVTDNVSLQRVYMGWITPKAFAPEEANGAVLSQILSGNTSPFGPGNGKASRLYRKLVYELRIAQDVKTVHNPLLLGSTFQIIATAKPGHTADELDAAIDAELAKFAAEGPTQAEVDAARQTIYTDEVSSLQRVGFFNGIADRLNRYNYYLKTPNYLDKDLARYATVTPQSVKQFAVNYLRKDARAVIHGIPGEKNLGTPVPTPPAPAKETASLPEDKEPWRNEPPKPAQASTLRLPRPAHFTLPNGLAVYHIEDHSLPLVMASLAFRSGSAADPSDLPGLGYFAADMLEQGTQSTDANKLAARVHELGASWRVGFDMDSEARGMECLTANSRAALSLLADVVQHPIFPESELERARQDRLTALLQERDSPPGTATRAFLSAFYGPGHPYGHTILGTEEALKRISRDDIARFHGAQHVPGNAALVVVGDLKPAEVRTLAQDLFGGWTGAAPSPRALPSGEMAGPRVVIVDKPGTPQTRLLVGQPGVARNDPDYDALLLMNTVMGGGFTSRINQNLREQHGYTYGTYSTVSENTGPGRIVVAGGIRTDVTGPAITEILKEVRGMVSGPVTDAELARAKGARIQALPGRFETSDYVAGQIENLFVFGLPDDYFQTLPSRLGSISAEDLSAMAKKHLTPDRMLVVAVGDRAKIGPQIESLGLGTIAVRDADGNSLNGKAAATK